MTRSSPFLGMGSGGCGAVGPGDGEVWAAPTPAIRAPTTMAAAHFSNWTIISHPLLAGCLVNGTCSRAEGSVGRTYLLPPVSVFFGGLRCCCPPGLFLAFSLLSGGF